MQLAAGKIRKRTAEEEAEEDALSKMTVSERLAHIKGKCGILPVAKLRHTSFERLNMLNTLIINSESLQL